MRGLNDSMSALALQQQALSTQQAALYGDMQNGHVGLESMFLQQQQQQRQNSIGGAFSGASTSINGTSSTVGGLLAPSNVGLNAARSAHSRAVSLPAFSQELFGGQQNAASSQASRGFGGHAPQGSFGGFGSAFGTGFGTNGFGGLGLQAENHGGLPRWPEEEVGAK